MWKKRVFLFLAGLSVILTAAFIICSKTVTEAPQPLPAPSPAPGPLDGIMVCVDPGHGGYDGGARGQDTGALEKDVNLAVALCLRQALQDAGAQVILTRETDTALAGEGAQRKRRDLQQRVDTASGAQVFLSIHMNEYRTRAESGPQVFYRAGQDDSRLLAGALQASLIQALAPPKQRAAMAGDYFILSLDLPSVLIECGFISNAAEERLLLDSAYQARLAQAVAQGVEDYWKMEEEND